MDVTKRKPWRIDHGFWATGAWGKHLYYREAYTYTWAWLVHMLRCSWRPRTWWAPDMAWFAEMRHFHFWLRCGRCGFRLKASGAWVQAHD